ncbi:putative alpha/beta-hydrolase family hydrolase [Allocatelliglobosispora scoriae]|uniref:Putative alpha/beta-hydrolase family hydrolase n=1 Tax=Allocatelliglobosispora scoriae TaxID=643052 RepID=A0A841BM25_9ACTN|nr:alpha/beta family hydrolase [Allocatelliglobosispora scoriae]MBB5868023.1 putative alpha/beta-hydrolase family hydrolase [Allocatelliglobosispora scoriae]
MLIATPRGDARVDLYQPPGRRRPAALLVLGHGAGGSVDAPDLVAVRDAAVAAGVRVAMMTQPYRVAGKRAPAPAAWLDEAFAAVLTELAPGRLPLIVGGRSSGARVACRTASAAGAAGVICLAFPLHPPGRPDRSRDDELPTTIPTLVVNGDRDPFGIPPARPGVEVVVLPGQQHDLKRDPAAVAEAVLTWLTSHHWTR